MSDKRPKPLWWYVTRRPFRRSALWTAAPWWIAVPITATMLALLWFVL